jgi:alkanesulfonate monooxygenase
VPFPPIAERFELLEEALKIAQQMWSDKDARFDGDHYHLERTLCRPQPLQRPHPPILIAGGGEKKTLRLVAQYGDACNLFGPPDVVSAKLAILREHCDRLGRDYDAIEKTTIGSLELGAGKLSAADVIGQCKAFAAVGVQHVIFNMPNVHESAPLEVFGREIIPAVSGF